MCQPSLLILPLFGLKSKKVHIKGKKKKSCTMLPNVQPEIAQPKAKKQGLQLLEVEKEPKYLGGRERGKIPIT